MHGIQDVERDNETPRKKPWIGMPSLQFFEGELMTGLPFVWEKNSIE